MSCKYSSILNLNSSYYFFSIKKFNRERKSHKLFVMRLLASISQVAFSNRKQQKRKRAIVILQTRHQTQRKGHIATFAMMALTIVMEKHNGRIKMNKNSSRIIYTSNISQYMMVLVLMTKHVSFLHQIV
jgi:hypothetical protein